MNSKTTQPAPKADNYKVNLDQSPQLAYRQEKADMQHSPQRDDGSYQEARDRLAEWEYEQDLDGSSMEGGRQ